MIWAAVIPAVASLVGSYLQSQSAAGAAGEAGKGYEALAQAQMATNEVNTAAQLMAQQQAMQYQQQQMDEAKRQQLIQQAQAVSEFQPYAAAGQNALLNYMGMLQAGPGQFRPEDQPGYTYGWEQTYRPMQGQAAKAGGLRSGVFQTALGNEAQKYAEGSYQNWLNRYYQALSPWQQAAGQGQDAARGLANIYMGNPLTQMYGAAGQQGMSTLSNAPQITTPSATGYGNILSGMNQMQQGNIWANALQNLGTNLSGYFQNQTPSTTGSYSPALTGNLYGGGTQPWYNQPQGTGYGPFA